MEHPNQRFTSAKQVLESHPRLRASRFGGQVAGAFILVIAVVIVYHNALSAYFFDDDFQWLVTSWSFHPGQLVAFGTMSHFYRPVIDVYFAVMTPLLGGSPVLFHAASIALHIATVLVLFVLARRIYGPAHAGGFAYGFTAALFFAVQPSDIDAVAWVGALAETIGALLGCLTLLWFLRWRDTGRSQYRALSVAAFTVALLTHESSVVFFPVLVLADWLVAARREWIRPFVPYAVLLGAYLTLDLWINSRNYLVSEGHYTFGVHIVTNALNYIVGLYVGRRDLANYAVIVVGVIGLLVLGNPRVRFATCWMLLALAPFLSFNWGNTSRYLYQPAIGFSLLLAEAMTRLDRRIAAVLVVAIALRFGVFANNNVRDFARRTQVYPQYLAKFRLTHGDLSSNSVVEPDPEFAKLHPHQFANAAVQWVYKDPTISIRPY